jgi:hypothetical protein
VKRGTDDLSKGEGYLERETYHAKENQFSRWGTIGYPCPQDYRIGIHLGL